MRGRSSSLWVFLLAGALLAGPSGCSKAQAREAGGGSALGDWGHFLSMRPRIHLLNPEGRDFSVTFHVMLWPNAKWNPETVPVRITGPDANDVIWKSFRVEGNEVSIAVSASGKGVYTIDWGRELEGTRWSGPNFWMETDLEHSVVWTGDPTTGAPAELSAVEQRRAFFQASVPRRWWFWVPEDVGTFLVRAQRSERHMSQREAWGLTITSPRGQRTNVLWGQPPRTARGDYRQEMEQVVEVVPGSGGRFWSIEIRNGDAHHHSSVNVTFEGIPPYMARSPEEWFDADTGTTAPALAYDGSSFIQAAYLDPDPERWPNLEHWSPSPSLGDPDGILIRGSGRFALWNPEGRKLKLALGDYLPRSDENETNAGVAEVGIEHLGFGRMSDLTMKIPHYHFGVAPPEIAEPLSAEGVYGVTVSGVERWWAFTYPATPLVLWGEGTEMKGRFSIEVGTARNWYFYVPQGTTTFKLAASVAHETDVVLIEVNTPDRTVGMIYGSTAERTFEVPAGMDGKIWHLRMDIGSASRMITSPPPRYLGVYLTLELEGVPPFLAPTWEQWFDPRDPTPPLQRAGMGRR